MAKRISKLISEMVEADNLRDKSILLMWLFQSEILFLSQPGNFVRAPGLLV